MWIRCIVHTDKFYQLAFDNLITEDWMDMLNGLSLIYMKGFSQSGWHEIYNFYPLQKMHNTITALKTLFMHIFKNPMYIDFHAVLHITLKITTPLLHTRKRIAQFYISGVHLKQIVMKMYLVVCNTFTYVKHKCSHV